MEIFGVYFGVYIVGRSFWNGKKFKKYLQYVNIMLGIPHNYDLIVL